MHSNFNYFLHSRRPVWVGGGSGGLDLGVLSFFFFFFCKVEMENSSF